MPKKVDHEQRRTVIATAAAQCIAELGMQGTTMRAIAQSSGFSKGIVEHYFTDKDEVISAALAQMNARYLAREEHLTAGLSGLSALRARLHCILPLDKASREEWKIRLCFWSVATSDKTHGRAQSKRLSLTRKRYQKDLIQAVELREIPQNSDLGQVAEELSLFMAGVACGALLEPRYYSARYLRRLIDRTLDHLTRELK